MRILLFFLLLTTTATAYEYRRYPQQRTIYVRPAPRLRPVYIVYPRKLFTTPNHSWQYGFGRPYGYSTGMRRVWIVR